MENNEIVMPNNMKSWTIARTFIGLVALIAVFICWGCDTNKGEISWYWLLPFGCMLFQIFLKTIVRTEAGIALVIMECVITFRYVLAPVLTCLMQDDKGLFYVAGSNSYFTEAIILMLLELFGMWFALYFWSRSLRLFVNESVRYTGRLTRQAGLIKYAIILYWFYMISSNPAIKSFMFVFNISTDYTDGYVGYRALAGSDKVIYYVGLVLVYVEILRIIEMISLFRKHGVLKLIIIVLASVAFISCTWSNGTDGVSRWGLLSGTLVMINILLCYFPDKRKSIIRWGLIGVLAILLIGTMAKLVAQSVTHGYTNITVASSISHYVSVKYFNEYFSGLFPVANGLNIVKNLEFSLTRILADTVSNVPFLGGFLGFDGSEASMVFFREVTGRNDLIMPNICSGYAAFGFMFANIYTQILTVLAIWANQKFNKSNNMYVKVFCLYIVFWGSLSMALNVHIIQGELWKYIIGLLIVLFDDNLTKVLKKR